ncbi:MAG: citrate transporter [Clostridiales bacterium]|nr:citrate transporter [Clostridiales bacterium]
MHVSVKKHVWHHHHGEIWHKITGFLKKNAVLCIAVCAALITCFIIPPDKAYLAYFDFKTLTCLFCVLAVVCALRNIRFFTVLARKIVRIFKTTRSSILALVYITFLGSMLIANDMALLTFLPLGYFVLSSTGKQKYMAFTFIMQNIAANLGGMLTPFGNPQNLYLYSFFQIPTGAFVLTMLPPFGISVLLITLCCMIFVKKEPLEIHDEPVRLPVARTLVYGLLFALSIIIVFRFIPYWIGLIVVPLALLFLDKKALKQVDYGLLFTFVAFFVFAGNMARIPAVERLLGGLIAKNPLIVSAASCQIISNVPSAILLSQFTSDWRGLLVGVNIGGAGTLIASLASLITFREYTSKTHGQTGKYILWFSLFNFGFLFTLTALEYFIFL